MYSKRCTSSLTRSTTLWSSSSMAVPGEVPVVIARRSYGGDSVRGSVFGGGFFEL